MGTLCKDFPNRKMREAFIEGLCWFFAREMTGGKFEDVRDCAVTIQRLVAEGRAIIEWDEDTKEYTLTRRE